jgi:Uncharacterized protein, homolog of phage Mu protein gp30
MADTPSIPNIPFDEAVAALRRRGLNLMPSDHWADVWQETHHTGFTVARSAGFDILGDIYNAALRAQEQGLLFRDFARDLTPILQKKGWWGRTERFDPLTGEMTTVQLGSTRRLRTIFDVNLRVSYAQGRWEQFQLTKDTHPYLCYDCVLDSHLREQHRRWYRIILPVDHPWWRTHYPPNGWKCRCDVYALSLDDLERMGLKVSTPPTDAMVTWVNPTTGETLLVPEGIDPGWAYNPGNTDAAARVAKLAMDKLIDLPPFVGAEAITAMAFAFPQVERELAEWLEQWTDVTRHAQKARRVVGCIDSETLAWMAAHADVMPETAAITIADNDVQHLMRTAKQGRGNNLSIDDVRRLPSLLGAPGAVYWDKGLTGAQRRDPGLIYVWATNGRGAGKIVVRVNFAAKVPNPNGKGRKAIRTNAVSSARLDITPEMDLTEKSGYIKIKGNL